LEYIKAADPEGILRKVAEAYSKSEAQVAVNCCHRKENVIAIP
jgi:diketogulonate reductase-like aldo/keto reductase